jgi:hypothetical protein
MDTDKEVLNIKIKEKTEMRETNTAPIKDWTGGYESIFSNSCLIMLSICPLNTLAIAGTSTSKST